MDRVADGTPTRNGPAAAELFAELDRAVERDPGHRFGIREVLWPAAYFPDPLVRVVPATLEETEDLPSEVPRAR
jgi:hypothetical protein